MLEDFIFDYSGFYERLLLASCKGFQLLKDRHADETFYCFAFYSHGSRSFLYSAASTEEGLTRVAQRYIDTWYRRWEGWIIRGLDGMRSAAKIDGFRAQKQLPSQRPCPISLKLNTPSLRYWYAFWFGWCGNITIGDC